MPCGFAAPWSRLLVGVTAGVGLLSVALTAALRIQGIGPWWVAGMPLGLFLAAAAFAIRGYAVEGGALVVRRPGWVTRVPLAGLVEARFDPGAMRGSLRLCGNGGLWVFAGWFWNRPLGRYRALTTDPHRTVVLTLANGTLVVSPADPDRFLEAVRAAALDRRPTPGPSILPP